jgi:predicted Zn-dependent protease with MMP-like domain
LSLFANRALVRGADNDYTSKENLLNQATRDRFDALLDEVLAQLPDHIHELIEQVPLHVEDYPSQEVMVSTGVRRRDQLCGLFTGIPITEHSIMHSGNLPNVVTIYREGILAATRYHYGNVNDDDLFEEIRITVLHELAHHHGLDEDELHELGYG